MVSKEIVCRQCKKEFIAEKFNQSYPRRYCDVCSKQRKKWWEERHLVKFEDCDED
jgi:hypothetical protein